MDLTPLTTGLGRPSLGAPLPPGFVAPTDHSQTGQQSSPTKAQVTGETENGGLSVTAGTPSARYIPEVPVKPGRVGRQVVMFEIQTADWYEVDVSVAGRAFHFKFALPKPKYENEGICD